MFRDSQDRETELERELERQQHRAQLIAARATAFRKLRQRFVVTALFVGALAGAAAAVAVMFTTPRGEAAATERLQGGTATLDELYLRGSLHVLDDSGREVALLGRESDQKAGPVVLGLYSPTEGEQTLRLATSESGSAISVRTPNGDSSLTLFAGHSGPELEINQGDQRRVISEQEPAPRVVTAAASGRALPAVGAASHAPLLGPQAIDLATSQLQDVGHGFLVSRLAATAHPNGVRIAGRIINTTSVRHRDLAFRIGLGGHAREFKINLISPGNSTSFAAVIPDASLDSNPAAEIEFLSSTVNYLGLSLKGHDGILTNSR